MDRRNFLGAAVVGGSLAILPGCKKIEVDPETIKTALKLAGSNGAYYGLDQWAKKDRPSAEECAANLKQNIEVDLLPYLNGGKLLAANEVQQMINTSLFKKVKEEVKDAIVAVSVALDAVLPIPDAGTYLTPEQVEYIKAFMTGLDKGCDRFLRKDKALKGYGNVWIK